MHTIARHTQQFRGSKKIRSRRVEPHVVENDITSLAIALPGTGAVNAPPICLLIAVMGLWRSPMHVIHLPHLLAINAFLRFLRLFASSPLGGGDIMPFPTRAARPERCAMRSALSDNNHLSLVSIFCYSIHIASPQWSNGSSAYIDAVLPARFPLPSTLLFFFF